MNFSATRLALPTVTLCAIDTRSPALAMKSLQHSMAQLDFAKVILFSCGLDSDAIRAQGMELVNIPMLQSAQDYSRFVLQELHQWIHTNHVLITQWDGFVVNAQAWNSEFLSVDYLGAPWGKAPDGQHVGNGGFSLRSRRLLLALKDQEQRMHHPEDICICQTNREFLEQVHGLRFGSLLMAQRFAFENETASQATFGFHGAFNFPQVLSTTNMEDWLHALPTSVMGSRDGYKLARNLLQAGQKNLAKKLLQRRRQTGTWELKSLLMELICKT
jgi:hypothetical protein